MEFHDVVVNLAAALGVSFDGALAICMCGLFAFFVGFSACADAAFDLGCLIYKGLRWLCGKLWDRIEIAVYRHFG